MQNDLLEEARQQAEEADASVRTAALLRIAPVEAHGHHVRARQTLLEGLDVVQKLTANAPELCISKRSI